jgi:RNA-binding protein with serine-rich domain 1
LDRGGFDSDDSSEFSTPPSLLQKREQRAKTPPPPQPIKSYKIFVDNLTRNVHEDHLKEIFEPCGHTLDTKIDRYSKTGISKGSATVEFGSLEEATKAVEYMNEGQIDGNIIKCALIQCPFE